MVAYRRFLRSQKGLALAMTAVLLPIFALVMVFAIDLGLAQTAQSRLETAVNQAVEVGVINLPDAQGAQDVAASVVRLALSDIGRFGSGLMVTAVASADVLEVSATMEAYSYFGALADRPSYEISAQAARRLVP